MPKKHDLFKKYISVFPLIFILGIAYWRYTYILNPNFSGEDFLVEIKPFQEDINSEILPDSLINIKSILIYWVLFLFGNLVFFRTLFNSFDKLKAIGLFYLLISFVSAVFFGLDIFWFKSQTFSSMGSILKNYLLSPMFTAIAYIVIKYLNWSGKPYQNP